MKLSLIVAMAANRAIGLNGQMPWHLSADLKKFKQITLGSPIIMGRKTFEAIGRPLPGRENSIISRDKNFKAEGCTVFNQLDDALAHYAENGEVFIIGGATLYQQTLHRADVLYLTLIHKEFQGDTFFPDYNAQQWQTVAREDINNDNSVSFSYSFLRLEKTTSEIA